ncbi:MAG TPA: endonuclease/exonuclease/phosphatase family protein [Pyrinomonadaceae bacterium]
MILKLLSYNIRFGGAGRERELSAVVRACGPDIVVLQEATRVEVVRGVSEATGMKFWAAREGHSLAYLSRLEIAHHEWHWPRGSRRAFMEIAPAGVDLRIYGVHLSAVHSAFTERRRMREMRALLAWLAQHNEGFHLLAGDFNTLAPGELLETRSLPLRLRPLVWLSGGRVRYQTIQIMLDAGYRDAFRHLYPDAPGEQGHTFPTWDPHVRLDFFFLPAAQAERLKACRVVRDGSPLAAASDHFPLLAEVEVN